MATDYNQILARDDYKRMTESLKEKVEEIARAIRYKMDELDVDNSYPEGGLCAKDVRVLVAHLGYGDTGFFDCLVLESVDEETGAHVFHSLEDAGDVLQEDRGFFVRGLATNKEKIAFLNAASSLIEKLGAIEQKNVEIVQNALNNI